MVNTFIILLAGLLPTYIIRLSLGGLKTNFFECAVWALFFIMCCMRQERKKVLSALLGMPFVLKIWTLLFLLSAVISTLHSPAPFSSLGVLKGWVFTPMVFGLLVYTAIYHNPHARKKIVHSLVGSGVVVALLGLSQINGFNRIYSLYDVPNSLALFLVPITTLALWIGVHERNKLYLFFACCMGAAILATQSFGALFALIATLSIAWFIAPFSFPGSRRIAVLIASSLVVVALLIGTSSGRIEYLIRPFIESRTSNSITVRFQLWDVSSRLIREHPLQGIGLGQFEPFYQEKLHELFTQQEQGFPPTWYGLQREFVFRDPHNFILSFWLNVGLLGLISFIALNVLALRMWKKVLYIKDIYSQAIILALISMLIFGLVDTIYWKNDLSVLWWMLVALLFPQEDETLS